MSLYVIPIDLLLFFFSEAVAGVRPGAHLTICLKNKVSGWLTSQGTEKYVPDLELHVLENCSHWVQQDQPELVEKLMRGFLERTDSTGTSSRQLSAARAA